MVIIAESLIHGVAETPRLSDDFDSACSTPFVSAPSSPTRCHRPGYFFSAPSSPMHSFLSSSTTTTTTTSSSTSTESKNNNPKLDSSSSCDFEFDFSSRLSSSSGPIGGDSMTSAEELFSNGQIKPMKLSSHLQRSQILSPFIDLENDEAESDTVRRGRDLKLRSRSVHRKARSLSLSPQWIGAEEEVVAGESEECIRKLEEGKINENVTSAETTPSCSASSSRSSSYGRNSKKWIFLKDLLLHRSKSEGGRGNGKEDKFCSNISFSPTNFKDKKLKSQPKQQPLEKKTPIAGKPTNGIPKRRGIQPSPHELHYTTNRAQAEEMRKRTYLPYRHGLFACLGFSSKGYSAFNGLARSLNPVSSG